MKRHVQTTGVRQWAGGDLIDLQAEPLKTIDAFFKEYGNCIIQGCEISQGTGSTCNITPGLVALEGTGHGGQPTFKVVPFAGIENQVLPAYLTLTFTTIERTYTDQNVKPIAYDYKAGISSIRPSEETPFLEITEAGSRRFTDAIRISEKLDKIGNGRDVTVTFPLSSERINVASGEKLSVLWSKVSTWFAALKAVAFSARTADLTDDAAHRLTTDTEKANWNDKYTRAETDTKNTATNNAISNLSADVYHKAETYNRTEIDGKDKNVSDAVNDLLANVYRKTETYNRTEIDNKDAGINNAVNTLSADVYHKAETYNRGEIDSRDKNVSDAVNDLLANVYRKTETYNRTEIDNKDAAITALANGKSDNGHRHGIAEINDFPNALPASDVYPWAKAPGKPSYTAAEVGAASVSALTTPQRIPAGSNLNSYTTAGHYYCDADVDADTISNKPASGSFALLVLQAAGCVQLYFSYYAAGAYNMYIRKTYNGAWGNWSEFYNTANFNPAAYAPVSHDHTADSITETAARLFLTPAERAKIETQGTQEIQIGTLANYDNYTETGKYYVFNVSGGPRWQIHPYFVLLEVEKLPSGGIYQSAKNSSIREETTTSGSIESYSRAYTGSDDHNLKGWTTWKPAGSGSDIQIGEKASYDDYTESGKYYILDAANGPGAGGAYFNFLEVEKLPNGAIYQTSKSSYMYSYADPNVGIIYIAIRAYIGDDFYSRKIWTPWHQIYPCLSGGTPAAYTLNSPLSDEPATSPVLPPTTTE